MVNLAGTVVLVPLFLAHWSVGVYGEWLVLSSLANYLSTLDLGMNSAAGNALLASHVRGDIQEFMRCQRSALAFYLTLAALATVLTGLVAWLLPLARWTHLARTPSTEAAWVVWLLALQVVWMLPVGFVCNLYRTVGSPAKTVAVTNVKNVAVLLVTAVALLLGAGMAGLALAQLVPVAVLALFLFADIRRRYPSLMPGLRGAEWGAVKGLLGPSALFAMITAGLAISQQGSVLVVSALGGVAVTIFVTTRTLANMAMQVVNILKNAAWPDLTILHAQQDWARLRRTNRMLVIVSGTLCIAISAALWFEGPSVVDVWTHHAVRVPPPFFRLMLLYLVMQTAWMSSSALLIATNRHHTVAWAYLVSSVLGVSLAAIGVRHFGLAAAPVGLMLGELAACSHFVVKESCAACREPYTPFALRVWLGGALVMAASLGAGSVLHGLARGPIPLHWVEVGAGTLLTAVALGWNFWLTGPERDVLRRKAAALKPRLPAGQAARLPA